MPAVPDRPQPGECAPLVFDGCLRQPSQGSPPSPTTVRECGPEAPIEPPDDSCQDARVAGFVDSSADARVRTGLVTAPVLLVVRVRSWAVRAWICRWMAAGFRSV